MAEKEEKLSIPSSASNGHAPSIDHTEAGGTGASIATLHAARELRKERRQKCLLYIILFIIFQTGIITLFALTVMKIRTPKFSVRSATFENFNVENTTRNPSFTTRMNAESGIKNSNFGRFKYDSTRVYFSYKGTQVGEVIVSKSHAKWRSTRKFDISVDLNFANVHRDSELASDLNTGVVTLTSQAKLRGTVELLFVIKKNKSTNMNCSMEILTATQQLRNIVCK